MDRNEEFMRVALEKARECIEYDEVPVGAVIVKNGEIIAACGNGRETENDATAHAETSAIREACKKLGGWHLKDCELYVTLEPCLMCAGAIVNARIAKVVFGAYDTKAGAMGSMTDITQLPVNHKPEIISGVLQEECSALLRDFFRAKRERGARWNK
ncbi:MAG: tRNA adenosine(34) deaminase TadA [Clostridia bacterium]|nr:tRNA adenosine(34) deaminase TadA [Clostridia bacterium]